MRNLLAMSLLVIVMGGCAQSRAALVAEVPSANSLGGIVVLGDKSILVSAPNVNDPAAPPVLARIVEGNARVFFEPPSHPDSGRAYPGAMALSPKNDVYLCDDQSQSGVAGRDSRVWRLEISDGRVGRIVPVVEGLGAATALAVADGFVYVLDAAMGGTDKSPTAGIYRFRVGEEGIRLGDSPTAGLYLVATLSAQRPSAPRTGGLASDGRDNLYCTVFGEDAIRKFTIGDFGGLTMAGNLARSARLRGARGLAYDPLRQTLYAATPSRNAVVGVTRDGAVRTMAIASRGASALDRPVAVAVTTGRLVVANGVDKAPPLRQATVAAIALPPTHAPSTGPSTERP